MRCELAIDAFVMVSSPMAARATMDARSPTRETIRGKEQMSYVESNLVPGETVIYQTRLHWIVMLGHIVLGCLLLGLPGVLLLYYAAQPDRN